jgi:hypothetical protein
MKTSQLMSSAHAQDIYFNSSAHAQPTRGGPPAWGLGEVLITPHRKKLLCYEPLYKASDMY